MVLSTSFRTLKPAKTTARLPSRSLWTRLSCLHLFCHITEECAFPKLAFSEKSFVKLRVDIEHVVPCLQELLLKLCAVLQGEMSKEAFQRLPLVLVEVVKALEAFLVGNVGEDGFCICQVLVDVVEVSHKHFAPAPEVVERFGIICPELFLHDFVQYADTFQRVGYLYGCEALEEVAHHAVVGSPYRLVAQQGKLAT